MKEIPSNNPESEEEQKKIELARRRETFQYATFMADVLVAAQAIVRKESFILEADDEIDRVFDLIEEYDRNEKRNETGDNPKIFEILCISLNSEIMEDFDSEAVLEGEKVFYYKIIDQEKGVQNEYSETQEEDYGYYMIFVNFVAQKHKTSFEEVSDFRDHYSELRDSIYEDYYRLHFKKDN